MQVIGFIFDMAEGIIWLCGAFGLLLGILYMLYDVLIKQVLLNKEVPIKTKIIEAIIVLLIILGGCGYWSYNYN
jgi:hypothetical protein